jgi:hypothetical protein
MANVILVVHRIPNFVFVAFKTKKLNKSNLKMHDMWRGQLLLFGTPQSRHILKTKKMISIIIAAL